MTAMLHITNSENSLIHTLINHRSNDFHCWYTFARTPMNQRRPLDSVLANEVLIVMNIERREDTHSHHITPHYSNYALAVQLLITQASNPNNQLFLWVKKWIPGCGEIVWVLYRFSQSSNQNWFRRKLLQIIDLQWPPSFFSCRNMNSSAG